MDLTPVERYRINREKQKAYNKLHPRPKKPKPILEWVDDSRPMLNHIPDKIERDTIRHEYIVYKGGKCILCGYNKHEGVLHFHHLKPIDKGFNIGSCCLPLSNPIILEELDKCVLVCANCHGEIHRGMHPELLLS